MTPGSRSPSSSWCTSSFSPLLNQSRNSRERSTSTPRTSTCGGNGMCSQRHARARRSCAGCGATASSEITRVNPCSADPDDLLLATDAAVVPRVAAGSLAHRQLVLDHPREVAGGDARGPLALHARNCSDQWFAGLPRRAPWPHVVHPNHRRAHGHGPGGAGQRRLGAVVDRRRRPSSVAEERLAAGADDHREPGGHEHVEVAQQGEVVMRSSCRSRCRDRSTPRRRPRPSAASARSTRNARTSATTSS